MKKSILFYFCILLLTSCVSTTAPIAYSLKGDVTAYNADGSILRQWDDVVIESGYISTWDGSHTTSNAIKSFGLNFTDPKTHKNIIISNAVPCIVEYTTQQTVVKGNEEYKMQNSSSHFNNEIQNLNKEQTREYIKSFIREINYDIENISSEKDLSTIKEKIETLTKYNNSLPKKNYLIIDALSSIRYEYKQKAKELGINQ